MHVEAHSSLFEDFVSKISLHLLLAICLISYARLSIWLIGYKPGVAGTDNPYVASVIKPDVASVAPTGLAPTWNCPPWIYPFWYCSPEYFSPWCCSLEFFPLLCCTPEWWCFISSVALTTAASLKLLQKNTTKIASVFFFFQMLVFSFNINSISFLKYIILILMVQTNIITLHRVR